MKGLITKGIAGLATAGLVTMSLVLGSQIASAEEASEPPATTEPVVTEEVASPEGADTEFTEVVEPPAEPPVEDPVDPTVPEEEILPEEPALADAPMQSFSVMSAPKPAYHLAVWWVPGGSGSIWDPDQVLVDHVITDTASLDLLDNSSKLVCGAYYQVDLYYNSEVTDYLISVGKLYDSGNPPEDLAHGAVPGNPWKFISTPPCPPEQVTPTLTFNPGNCFAAGSVVAVNTDKYTWAQSGPASARVYTASPVGNVQLTQTVFGPYDLRQTAYTDPACKPVFQYHEECAEGGKHVTITYVNNSKWDRWPDWHYTGDGVAPKDAGSGSYYTAVKVLSGETKVIFDHTFPEDYNGGTVEIQYQDILGAERDIDTAKVVVNTSTDCVEYVPPTASGHGECKALEPGQNPDGSTAIIDAQGGSHNEQITVWLDGVHASQFDFVLNAGQPINDMGIPFDEDSYGGSVLVELIISGGEGDGTVIASFEVETDCGTIVTYLASASKDDECGPGYTVWLDGSVLTDPVHIDHVTYELVTSGITNGVGDGWIKAVPDANYSLASLAGDGWIINQNSGAAHWPFTVTSAPCEVTPVAPVWTQPTCETAGSWSEPEQPEGVVVTTSDDGRTVTFSPADGFVFPKDTQTVYDAADVEVLPKDCDTTTTTGGLPLTGTNATGPLGLAGGLLLLGTIAMIVVRHNRAMALKAAATEQSGS